MRAGTRGPPSLPPSQGAHHFDFDDDEDDYFDFDDASNGDDDDYVVLNGIITTFQLILI